VKYFASIGSDIHDGYGVDIEQMIAEHDVELEDTFTIPMMSDNDDANM
jgi:hypothetical protein